MPKLTAKSIQALKDKGRYGDGEGLYLEVSRTGSKSWILRTTVQGRRQDIGLGGISWVSLAEAREKARELRKVAKEGGDPKAKRDAHKKAPTYEEVARTVFEHLKPGWRQTGVHVKHWITSQERYVFPLIGNRPINTVESRDILSVLQPIWFRVPETARKVKRRVRQVMQWAKGANLYVGENPVDAASGSLPKHQVVEVQHYPALPYREMPVFMADLISREGIAVLALRFLILTVARSGEVRGMTWAEIDFENGLWVVPGSRMKAHKEHRVPLTNEALAVLEAARGLDANLVFPGRKRGRPMSDMTLAAVIKRMGRTDSTPHGMRSSFRDWVAEQTNIPREIAELSLAHEVGSVVERSYRRSDLLAKRRDLMERWAWFCCPVSADVIELRG